MTVRDFAEATAESTILKIVKDGVTIVCFDSAYTTCITDEVLDLEIACFKVNSALFKKPEIEVYVADEDFSDFFDPEPDDEYEGEDEDADGDDFDDGENPNDGSDDGDDDGSLDERE